MTYRGYGTEDNTGEAVIGSWYEVFDADPQDRSDKHTCSTPNTIKDNILKTTYILTLKISHAA